MFGVSLQMVGIPRYANLHQKKLMDFLLVIVLVIIIAIILKKKSAVDKNSIKFAQISINLKNGIKIYNLTG